MDFFPNLFSVKVMFGLFCKFLQIFFSMIMLDFQLEWIRVGEGEKINGKSKLV